MTAEIENARRYAVVSGKGGVGKTVVTANLAAALAATGKRTLVIDGDLGLANLDVIMGLCPKLTLHDVVRGRADVSEVIVTTPAGFDLLPAGSGLVEGTHVTASLAAWFERVLSSLDRNYDIILFDAGAGIGEVVLFFARMAHGILLVVTPEPTSITDAYATIKVMSKLYEKREFDLIVNLANPTRPAQTGSAVAGHLQEVVSRFLSETGPTSVRLNLIGSVPRDSALPLATSRQQLLLCADPQSPAARSIRQLAEKLVSAQRYAPAGW
jgi:flagellar biosynthesis protein FlhG